MSKKNARAELVVNNKNNKTIDYLNEDPIIRNQQLCIMSFVGPNLKQKSKINAFKVRGSFNSREEAESHITHLEKIDPDFDMFIAPVGIWCPFNPDPDEIEEQKYGDTRLNDLMKGYHENRLKADEHFNDRKRQMIQDAMKDGTKEGQKELSKIKEHPIAVKQRLNDLQEKLKQINESLEETNNFIKENELKLLNHYTKEELEIADNDFAEYKKRIQTAESKDELADIQEELRKKYTEYEKEHNNPEDLDYEVKTEQLESQVQSQLEQKDPWLQNKKEI